MNFVTISYTSLTRLWSLRTLSAIDLGLSFIFVLFALLILLLIRSNKEDPIYKYYIPFFLFKIIACLAYVYYYVYISGGGDTTAYWATSNSLIALSFQSFSAFFNQVFSSFDGMASLSVFSSYGIPAAGWIVREQEGYFMAKLAYLPNLLSGQNFLLTSFYFATWSFVVQWRFYRFIRTNFLRNPETRIHLLILFLPSTAFWCSGLSKDTVVVIGLLSMLMHLIKWFALKQRSFKSIFWIVFYFFILMKVREISLATLIGSFALMWGLTLANGIGDKGMRVIVRLLMIMIGGFIGVYGISRFGIGNTLDAYLAEAEVVQDDFANNETYGGTQYSIGIESFTIPGMILASPMAIIAGLFRPFIWEALSLTLFLNGIEGLFFLYMSFKKIFLKWGKLLANIFSNKIILFSLLFALAFSFAAGLTSVIFGVLVRIRAPALLLFAIFLCWEDIKKDEEERLEQEEATVVEEK